MHTVVVIDGRADGDHYLTWSPLRATLALREPVDANPVNVVIDGQSSPQGGQLEFSKSRLGTKTPTLQLTLKANGSPVTFYVAGKHGKPSTSDKDTSLRVRMASGKAVLSATPIMVRIRKDANVLTDAERDRFLNTLGELNNLGQGLFFNFRDMHVDAARREAHGRSGFLPWHRAYILDLERSLQAIDPSVTLPYWNFDKPAPKLFTREFLGVPDSSGILAFSRASHPLAKKWATDGQNWIWRDPLFSPSQRAGVRSEADAMRRGNGSYGGFRLELENDPHGQAHVSFTGWISSIPTAAKDPLFFLLHANVDRIWAGWQASNRAFDGTKQKAYDLAGTAAPNAQDVGHHLNDTMWPWNGIKGSPRPNTAPGNGFTSSPNVSAPGLKPTLASMIDWQGRLKADARLAFDYDTIPFGA